MLVGGHNMHGCWTTRRCWGWFQDGCSHCYWCQSCVDCVDSFYSGETGGVVNHGRVVSSIIFSENSLTNRYPLRVNIWNHICLTSCHKSYYVRRDVLHKQWFHGLSKTWCVKGLPPQESSRFERGFKESKVKIWIRIFIWWICITLLISIVILQIHTLPISIVILQIYHIGSVINQA